MKSRKEVLRFKAEIMEELENISRIAGVIEKRKREMKKHTLKKDIKKFINLIEKISR